MSLRPVQALALHDIGVHGGLFGPIRVGGGKTLTTLLAAYVLEATRPILLLPAALVEKTERERRELAKHWRIPTSLRIISYEMLGRVQSAETLTYWQPDLIVADEAHRLKNKRAGVTRRVVRYMREHPETRFVAVSGTMMKHSLRDFAHLLRWSLKDGAPIPATEGETDEWADALDEKVNPLQRLEAGALARFAVPGDTGDELSRARRGFQRRLIDTPGVVATSGEQVSCSLYVAAVTYDTNSATEANYKTLRALWETPDGWSFSEAVEMWRYARQLALGIHYIWDPRPPKEWMNARREWHAFVRETLSHSRTLDTELQVRMAVKRGALETPTLGAWEAVAPSYTPCSKALWHDSSALEVCQKWIEKGPGIVWTEHTFFAEELARRTGLAYFGDQGKDATGRPIELADPKSAVIASIAANSTGRNLQAWSRNLVTSPPAGADAWEQLLGRTHRDGQTADEVTVDVLFGCYEHADAWTKALAGAEAARDTLGQPQKLLLADKAFPSPEDVARFFGERWKKSLGGRDTNR